MKKYDKRDFFSILFIIASFFIIFLVLIINKGVSYGSTIDYQYQHYMIPEYFRTLFYDTKQVFPSYAFNLGMGQNIYNFSYYGLLSPIILFSYLFPFITMKTYLEIASIIIVILSIILFYYFISLHEDNKKIRFITTFLFAMAVPLSFHTHRHIMFMCYMPFLILSLIAINKRNISLLIVSNVLILTSSYFFSVPALISIYIYSIYLYLDEKVIFKKFIKDHFILAGYFIISVLISMVLLLPSLMSILDNRFKEASDTIFSYLIPNIDLSHILYNSYGMGLTSIFIVSIIYGLVKGNRSSRFLSIVFLMFIILPIFNYILNGFMYINSKVLIPFVPLAIVLIKNLFNNLKDVNIFVYIGVILFSLFGFFNFNLKILFIIDLLITIILLKKEKLFIILLVIISFSISLSQNLKDNFGPLSTKTNQYDSNINKLINNLDNSYRISDLTNLKYNENNIRNINMYKTTMYSSVTNKYYKEFFWNTFDNENKNRNDAIFSDIENPLFNIYVGNRYLVTNKDVPIGYKMIDSSYIYNLYENKDVFSIGYASDKLMSKKEFDSLKYPYKVEALLNYIIVDEDVSSNYKTNIKEESSLFTTKIENSYEFAFDKDEKFELDLKEKKKILIIKFDMLLSQSCFKGDTSITINGVKNTLTCESWKYHNNNYSFTYVLSDVNKLNIEILKGEYKINNIKFYTLDYQSIKGIDHDNFVITKQIGDVIEGAIDVTSDGYFAISVPYDKCYNIYVNGEKIDYEKVNAAFVGFKLDKGSYNIKIVYIAPGIKIGKVLSFIGICLFIFVWGVRKNEKDIHDNSLF